MNDQRARFYELRDRVPCEEIDALTVEAARVWLGRNGWTTDFDQAIGEFRQAHYENGQYGVWVISAPDFPGQNKTTTMLHVISVAVESSGRRAHVVIAEIRAIADLQKRCAEWVEPKDGENCSCWACECKYADVWEAPPVHKFVPSCPTCSNKRCPRATDHRNGCSGSNEPGQEGSRYA